jgi:hypothetical protein
MTEVIHGLVSGLIRHECRMRGTSPQCNCLAVERRGFSKGGIRLSSPLRLSEAQTMAHPALSARGGPNVLGTPDLESSHPLRADHSGRHRQNGR